MLSHNSPRLYSQETDAAQALPEHVLPFPSRQITSIESQLTHWRVLVSGSCPTAFALRPLPTGPSPPALACFHPRPTPEVKLAASTCLKARPRCGHIYVRPNIPPSSRAKNPTMFRALASAPLSPICPCVASQMRPGFHSFHHFGLTNRHRTTALFSDNCI